MRIRATWWFGVLVAAQTMLLPHPTEAQPAPDGDQHISIPVRWCAVRGSPATEIHTQVPELTKDAILRGRHGRATAYVWMPEAGISFRSALTADLPGGVGFPLIDDPRPPHPDGSGGAGLEGDILDYHFDVDKLGEMQAAVASCEQAWEALEDQFDTHFRGIIAVNIRRFVRPDGSPSQTLGVGISMNRGPYQGDRCQVPSDLATYEPLASNDGWVIIVDNQFTVGTDPEGSVLAHELGHVLFLGHGNGVDDPQGYPPLLNRRYDSFCDKQEDLRAMPETLMSPKHPMPSRLTAFQRAGARAAAKVTVGGLVIQAGEQQSEYRLSDEEVDKVGEVSDPSVDLRSLGIIYDTREGTTTLTYRLVGRLPKRASKHQFLLLLDNDANASTGGEPATLGFPTQFQGAEYVAQVRVESKEGQIPLEITSSVWHFRDRSFVKLPVDERIEATVAPVIEAARGKRVHDVVSVQFPNDIGDQQPSPQVRFQAVVERVGGEVDRLPDEADRGLRFRLTKPIYHACRPIPYAVKPGGEFRIEATGFDANKEIKVLLNEVMIAEGTSDSSGNMSVPLQAPEDAEDGLHLLVVEEVGTAMTSHCVVTVEPEKVRKGVSHKKVQ